MRPLFHSTILATTFAATLAVGIASAAMLSAGADVATKSDRLEVVAPILPAGDFVTVETRGAGVSILERQPIAD